MTRIIYTEWYDSCTSFGDYVGEDTPVLVQNAVIKHFTVIEPTHYNTIRRVQSGVNLRSYLGSVRYMTFIRLPRGWYYIGYCVSLKQGKELE